MTLFTADVRLADVMPVLAVTLANNRITDSTLYGDWISICLAIVSDGILQRTRHGEACLSSSYYCYC